MGRGGSNPARLALSLLEDQAIELLLMDIAPSTLTQRLYSSAQQAYWQFCSRLKLSPLLATQDQLILFVPEQTQTKAPSTIKMYLAGICHYHIISGYLNPQTLPSSTEGHSAHKAIQIMPTVPHHPIHS